MAIALGFFIASTVVLFAFMVKWRGRALLAESALEWSRENRQPQGATSAQPAGAPGTR